ncbi:glycosyltransferase [Botrimarina hoheduenensis]|uniref:Alpha 1,4-glycosyltransferase domain-containing protein n=1 Tax=Botrimarina hoheduenensis TaxID=2528000 RepID=A0A5C5W7A3_9BACT|nr:glycosyltransferase [Botrimarina hoheduenensis]TWT46786.1 hypothetical protein Pla111_18870 [Botrimarina hoheduenensis]
MSQDVFQSLWIGDRLGPMEQLSIESFLHFGYDFRLFAYGKPAGVPEGVRLVDAREVLPESEVFFVRKGFGKGSPAYFADRFRYTMLHQRGGWWVDTDMICVAPWEFDSAHVVGAQRQNGPDGVNNAVIRSPAGSALMARCLELFAEVDLNRAPWGSTGPLLLERAIRDTGLLSCVQPADVFYPVDYWAIEQLFEDTDLPEPSRGVHLWNAVWARRGIDSGAPMPPECLYEQMRRCFLRGYEPPELTPAEIARLVADLALANAPPPTSLLGKIRDRLKKYTRHLRVA